MKIIKEKTNKIQLGSKNYLADYLVTLGIPADKVDSFLIAPKDTDIDNPYNLNNMEHAINVVHQYAEEHHKFYVQVDCDVDGFTSAAIFVLYMKSQYPDLDIVYDLHDGKQHGIELAHIGADRDIIIVPDAGSMQLEEQKKLADEGRMVVIFDHHEVLEKLTNDNVVLVNNQDSDSFKNKELSGAGMVLMFCKAFDEKYSLGMQWQVYMDLAAVGIIADMMDTRTLGNNYIIWHGLSHIHNKTLQAILQKQSFHISDMSHPNKIDIAFYVAPLINGLIRSGRQEEKEIFFRAMITSDSQELITTTFRGKTKTETLYEYAVRVAANAKNRQDTAKKRGSVLLNQKIKTLGLDKHKILAVPVSIKEQENIPSTLTGLIAMELLKEYNKPTMVLRESQDEFGNITYSGSLRSKDFYGFPSFMGFINNSKLGTSEGHPNAAGVTFSASNLKEFITYADARLTDVDFDSDYIEVDYWFKDAINVQMLEDFARGMQIYGNGIPQPKFALSCTLSSNEVGLIGADESTIKFYFNGVDCVMFKQPTLAKQLKKNIKSRITVVGRAQINDYNNRAQLIIDAMDITPVQEVSAWDLL